MDDNGNVSIYSQNTNTLFTYSLDGVFLEKKKLPYATERFISNQGFNYHYIGTASREKDYKLYVTDDSGKTVGEFLPSQTAPALPNNRTFSLNENTLYLCPPEGNDIYKLQNNKIEPIYSFDFGKYNIPEKYYECTNLMSLGKFLNDKTVVMKLAFWENSNCAI